MYCWRGVQHRVEASNFDQALYEPSDFFFSPVTVHVALLVPSCSWRPQIRKNCATRQKRRRKVSSRRTGMCWFIETSPLPPNHHPTPCLSFPCALLQSTTQTSPSPISYLKHVGLYIRHASSQQVLTMFDVTGFFFYLTLIWKKIRATLHLGSKTAVTRPSSKSCDSQQLCRKGDTSGIGSFLPLKVLIGSPLLLILQIQRPGLHFFLWRVKLRYNALTAALLLMKLDSCLVLKWAQSDGQTAMMLLLSFLVVSKNRYCRIHWSLSWWLLDASRFIPTVLCCHFEHGLLLARSFKINLLICFSQDFVMQSTLDLLKVGSRVAVFYLVMNIYRWTHWMCHEKLEKQPSLAQR